MKNNLRNSSKVGSWTHSRRLSLPKFFKMEIGNKTKIQDMYFFLKGPFVISEKYVRIKFRTWRLFSFISASL